MARDETDREDLLREATALVERIELCATGFASASDNAASEHIVVGFRAGGELSIFFGADPVYQFNAAGELRRAYWDGLLYKAERGRLVSLERVRTASEVQIMRRNVSDEDTSDFLDRMRDRLHVLAADLATGNYQVIGQIPETADVLGRVRNWFAQHDDFEIARSARVTPT
jgi:hypothetical protein